MKKKAFLDVLLQVVGKCLEGTDFSLNRQAIEFVRGTAHGHQAIGFHLAHYGNSHEFQLQVMVRVDDEVKISHRYLSDEPEYESESRTVCICGDFFDEPEREVSSTAAVLALESQLCSAIRDRILPLLDSNQSAADLDRSINRERCRDWTYFDPNGAVTEVVLAVLARNPGLEDVISRCRHRMRLFSREVLAPFFQLVSDIRAGLDLESGQGGARELRDEECDLLETIEISGFDDLEPAIQRWTDGSLWIQFETMPPWFSQEDGTEDDFQDFQTVLQQALGVPVAVSQEDREVFIIAHPQADTAQKAQQWLETYHERMGSRRGEAWDHSEEEEEEDGDLVETIEIEGFDPDGEPVIKRWADGSLWIHFEAMPPFFAEEDGTEDDFEDFQAVLQAALGVPVTQDDREVFVIEHPLADTVKKAKKWLESFHKRKNKEK